MTEWILALLVALAPPGPDDGARYASIAEDIAAQVADRREAAVVVAIMVHESGLRLEVDEGLRRGQGRDVCLMQLRDPPEAVLTSRPACIREGLRKMRSSLARCGDLRAYASGTCIAGAAESRAILALVRP